MFKPATILFSFLLVSGGLLLAQDEAEEQGGSDPKVTAALQDLAPKTSHVFVIFTDSKPDQIIVLDENGSWIPDVKSILIEMTIGEQPQCTCTIWSGFYKPTAPTKKTWPLKQARSVTPDEFQEMIDKLQADPGTLAGE